MIEKYRSEVIELYEKKKAAGELSLNLVTPTCAKIRNECLQRFRERCEKGDQRMLNEFLGRPLDEELTELTIKRCDADTFKSLSNFLRRNIKTREKNIELLAWLINFKPRPCANYWLQACNKTKVLSTLEMLNKETADGIKTDVTIRADDVLQPGELRSDEQYKAIPGAPQTFNINIFVLLLMPFSGAKKMWERVRNKLAKNPRHGLQKEKQVYPVPGPGLPEQEYWFERSEETIDRFSMVINQTDISREVLLEYPSGVKVSVDAANIPLIAQLVRL